MENITRVHRWEPSYARGCVVCGLKPVVLAVDADGLLLHDSGLCGACTWSDSAMSDPTLWNDDDEQGGANE
jgi:hypothetical protein